MKKYIIIATLLILAIVAGIWIFVGRSAKVSYKTVPLEKGSVVAAISATGTVNPVTTVQVGSQVSGTIQKLLVDYNSRVKKGQIIAEIDPALFLAQVEQARGNFLNAQAGLQKARVVLADAKRTLERNRQLISQGIVAQSDFDASQTAYDSALAGIKSAEAGVTQYRGTLMQAETNLKNSVIRSPVDGVVISRSIDVGQTVAASFQTPTLFSIAQDLTKMQIETSVDEADISRARLDQTATFTVDAYPDRSFKGRVTQIRSAPITVQNVVTYIVVVQVDNKDLHLKPGMTANVSIETGRRDGVLKLPAAALRFRPKTDADKKSAKAGQRPAGSGKGKPGGAQQKVYLLKDDKPVAVAVTTGLGDASFIELVEGGLQEGDQVIVEQLDKTKKKASGMGGSPMGPRM
ncbi:MAG: efflux RND transporter periplasmic adaptor subunit [Trichlorobacter sp.]|uniref:efflux RND transporter periplasmic adaptor subunit n=1 Tax=Trichlorobacter sp. TaxID=2911007 RepID=UPI002568E36E|nr:efflux RND transporter periplasmic adaptor subunit [Trichlorobacter sp.]MDK9716346.1 efflux RND transporter periplasmic adaptor subunit [Trichlorobacter sp.]